MLPGVVGCRSCVDRWCSINHRCPLCSITGKIKESFQLKGIDDLSARSAEGPVAPMQPTSPPTIDVDSDDSANDR